MQLTSDDWQRLRALRERFLTDPSKNYWNDHRDLELYNLVYAERIGWKWAAVLQDLNNTGWCSSATCIADWGCGTGIASRYTSTWSGINRVRLVDQSSLATTFTREALQTTGIDAAVHQAGEPFEEKTLFLASHVISELNSKELLALATLAATADEVIWVEPGAHDISRQLGTAREILITAGHHVIAPCTHQLSCPILQEGKERDWCHFFAQPPTEIFQSAFWHEASRQLSIDLRSLPYSYLATSRDSAIVQKIPSSQERLIGYPRELKAHAKILSCGSSGLCERVLQKRDNPELFKRLIKKGEQGIFTWKLDAAEKIVAGTHSEKSYS